MSDEDLYSRISDDSREAFDILYDRHSGPLFRFIYRFTTNSEEAEEILHDIFIQVLSRKFQCREKGSLKSWLYTLAKNKSLNHIKKSSFEIKSEVLSTFADSGENLETQTVNKGLLKKLRLVESVLPKDLSQTWQLKKEGWDHHQIAEKLSIPVGTVKSRFHRLVEHLRKEFKNEL